MEAATNPTRALLAAAPLAILWLILIGHLRFDWSVNPKLSYGWLVPFLTLYLCWIASINRRSRPTVVAGVWDFAFLMVGLLGFILVGCILAVSLFGFVSYYLQRANFANLTEDWRTHRFQPTEAPC